MSDYLDFMNAEANSKRKTNIYHIFNKNTGDFLGKIKWHSSWRQYCFYPDEETHWARGCMQEVYNFIEHLMICKKNDALHALEETENKK